MLNPVFTYELSILDSLTRFVDTFFNESELIILYTIKCPGYDTK